MQSEKKNKKQIKVVRTTPANLDEMLEITQNSIINQNKLSNKRNKDQNKNSELSNLSTLNKNKQKQNINISNTNPYIINQNNYFNGFNHTANIKQLDQNGNSRIYYPQPQAQPIAYPIDIPHPNNFIAPGNDLNYQFNPVPNDSQYIWNNYPFQMNPLNRLGYCPPNSSIRPYLPPINEFYNPNSKNFPSQLMKKK